MKKGYRSCLSLAAGLAFCALPTHAALSKVLHYTRTGFADEYLTVSACSTALEKLAAEYGFRVTHSKDPKALLDLPQYDLVIYDNNSDAGRVGPVMGAPEKALVDYMEAGGGLLAIGWAAAHRKVWGWYDSVLFSGVGFSTFTSGGSLVFTETSPEAKTNAPIARMWAYARDSLGIAIDSVAYPGSVAHIYPNPRGRPGVVILQVLRRSNVSTAGADEPESWVRYLDGGGRMLYTGLGLNSSEWTEAFPWLAKATYAYMRFLAGDFDAPIALRPPGIRAHSQGLEIKSGDGQRMRILDISGREVYSGPGKSLGSLGLEPGIYFPSATGTRGTLPRMVVIPGAGE